MPRKPPKNLLKIRISFPNSPKYAKDRKAILKKLKAWIREEKESLSIEEVKFERNAVSLMREEFFWHAKFQKPISTFFAIRDPEKNIELANEFGNKILNYLKTILDKFAFEAELTTDVENYSIKLEDLARKMIGESRLARINEITKKTLHPLGVIFEYEKDGRANMFMAASKNGDNALFAISSLSFKDTIPWDVVLSEYTEMKEFEQTISKLLEQEV